MKKDKKNKEVIHLGRPANAVVSKLPDIPISILENPDELRLMICPNCGGVHFRHAGYLKPQTVYVNPDKVDIKVISESTPVELCVACKHAFINVQSKVWDVTKFIDLDAWIKTEKEAHEVTGPGGQC